MTTKTPILGTELIPIKNLFTDFVFGKQVILPNCGGSRTEHPKDYLFVAGLRSPEETRSVNFFNNQTYFLYGRPTPLLIDAVIPRCVNGELRSFEIIKWNDRALVIGIDKEMIAHVWAAFVPLADLKEINPHV